MASKKYTVQHTMLGSLDPETGENHRQGQVVSAEDFGDKAVLGRFLKIGAVRESTKEEIDADTLTKENAANEKAVQDAIDSGDGEAYAEALAKVTTGNDKTQKQAKQADGSVSTDQGQGQGQK
jgi:hypothetical protein